MNWRTPLARSHNYLEAGEALIARVRALIVLAAALKILGLPTGWTIALMPVALVGQALIGYAWVQYGWYRHQQVETLAARWSPWQVFQAYTYSRLLKAHGLEVNHYDPNKLPDDVMEAMRS